jgi:BirA family biotin operon repressor/biotin-[acetyl-CoA-carboxylase] ligase
MLLEVIYHHFESLTSTNDWMKAYLEYLPEGRVALVTADTQTKGRGQYGRSWFSPKGVNLYASFGYFVDQEENPLSSIRSLATSAAALLTKRGVDCSIKWPNDLFVNGKKIAGILCETVQNSLSMGIVVGIGLNVNMSYEYLERIDQPATSLFLERGSLHEIGGIL